MVTEVERVLNQASAVLKHFPRIGISVLNQVLASGKNFILTLYIVRVLEPEQFGFYGIGIAVVLLYAGIGNALLLTQMVVRMPEKSDSDRPIYCANMLALCCLFMLLTLLLALTAMLLLEQLVSSSDIGNFIFAIALAGVATVATNYFVRFAYSTFREMHALLVHAISVIVLVVSFVLAHYYGSLTTATEVLWLYALAHISGAIIGLVKSSLPLRSSIGVVAMTSAFRQSFSEGKWALGGVGVTWLQSQSYLYITTIYSGAGGVATLNAGRILISPFTFLLPAFSQLILPRLAQMREKNVQKLVRTGVGYALGLVALGAIYIGIIAVVGHWLIPLIVGPKYETDELYWLSLAWGVVLLFQLCRTAASLVLQATLRFKSLALTNSVTALATFLASLALTPAFGLIGTLSAVGIGEALLAGLLWLHIRRNTST